MDGVFEVVHPGEEFVYEFPAKPAGMHLYHCHTTPLKKHIHKGLYGAFIIDPKEPRPPAHELVLVMNGYDTDGDGGNNFYTVNGRSFYYTKYPITVRRSETVRDLPRQPDGVRSDQLPAPARGVLPAPADRDRRSLGVHRHGRPVSGPAGCARDRLHAHRPVHVPRASIGVHRPRLDGLLQRDRLMEAKAARRGDLSWRLWALVPILLLAVAVGGYVASGSSLAGLIGSNPPQADEFDVRRVQFKPGEILVKVTNPQQDDLTIASVTVDDAIVPFEVDGPHDPRPAPLEHDRDPLRLDAGRPDLGRCDQLHRHRDGRGDRRRGRDPRRQRRRLSRLRDHRLPGRRAARRAGPPLAAVAAPGRTALADGVHGPDRRPARVSRRRGAVRGVRAAGSAPGCVRRPRSRPARRWPRAS